MFRLFSHRYAAISAVAATTAALAALPSFAQDWARTNGPQEPLVTELVPAAGNVVYANAAGDVYRSADGGATWTLLDLETVLDSRGRAIRPGNNVGIATGGGWLYLAYRGESDGLLASNDGGATFTSLKDPADRNINSTTLYANATHVYVRTEREQFLRAAHGSTTFTDVEGDLPDGIFEGRPADVFDVFATGDTICVTLDANQAEGNHVYKSTDGGQTYAVATGEFQSFFNQQIFASADGSNIYLRDGAGLLRSTDQCGSFTRQTASDDFDTASIYQNAQDMIVRADGSLLVAPLINLDAALYVSTDAGVTLTPSTLPSGTDRRQSSVTGFGRIAEVNGAVLAGSQAGGLFREASGALVESDTGMVSSNVSQLLAGNNPGEIIAVTSSGLAVSNDAGASWVERTSGFLAPPKDIERIGDTLYSLTGLFDPGTAVQKSTDGGVTWNAVGTSLPRFDNLATTELVVSGDRLFVLGRSSFTNAVYTSADGGDTWTQATAEGFEGLAENAVSHKGAIFVSAQLKILRSTDQGATFTQVGQGQGDGSGGSSLNIVGTLLSTPDALYVSGPSSSTDTSDVYVSYDNGESWGSRTDLSVTTFDADDDGNLYGYVTTQGKPGFLAADSNAWEIKDGGLLDCDGSSRFDTVAPSEFYVSDTQVFGGMNEPETCAPAGVWVADRGVIPTGDRRPDAFFFDDGFNTAFVSTESNAVTITGIDQPAPISVAGGSSSAAYSIGCDGSFTDDPGTITNGETVCLRDFTGFGDGDVKYLTLRVGGYAAPWKLTTGEPQEDAVPNAFGFETQADVTANSVITSNTITLGGFNVPVDITVSGGEYSINCAADGFTTADGTVESGARVCVRHTSSDTAGARTITTLTVGGEQGTFESRVSNQSNNDTTPDPFTFVDQADVATDTVITSNTITVSGTNNNATLEITGGAYSIDCNDNTFTDTSPTTIPPNTQLCVRHTSASTAGTTTDTVLTIGGVSDTFTSTTAGDTNGPDTTPDPFNFTDQSEVAINTVIVSDSITVAGIDAAATIEVTGGEYSIGCDTSAFTAAVGTIANGQTVCVRHTSAAEGDAVTNTTLTIGTVSDTFTTTTASDSSNPVGDTETVTDPSGGTTTVTSTDGNIENLTNSPNPPAGSNPPSNVTFPNGVFSFDVTGLQAGQTIDITITLPTGSGPDTYYKFLNGGSFEFLRGANDPEGATINGNVITLRLTDGGLGDADGTANGVIEDPGAPGVTVAQSSPVDVNLRSSGAVTPWMLLMLAGLGAIVRRRRADR